MNTICGIVLSLLLPLVVCGGSSLDDLRRNAESGDAGSMALLGLYYEEGCGDELIPDQDLAVKWYSKAATKGHSLAARRLEYIEKEARSSRRKAAEKQGETKSRRGGLSIEEVMRLSAEEKYGGKISEKRLGSVRPQTGIIYPYYSYTAKLQLVTANHGRDSDDLKVSSVSDDGVDVRGDNFPDTRYFVDTKDEYVDGDLLRDGWYQCIGRKKEWSGTVFRFRRVEFENGDVYLEKMATSKIGKEFAEEFTRHIFGM